MLALVIFNRWKLRHVDVNNPFLNGSLVEEAYMRQPPGFEVVDAHGNLLAYKVNEALYSLKQALRAWFKKLHDFLVQNM